MRNAINSRFCLVLAVCTFAVGFAYAPAVWATGSENDEGITMSIGDGLSENLEGVSLPISTTGNPDAESENDEGLTSPPATTVTPGPNAESENNDGISLPADPDANSENDEGLTSPPAQTAIPDPDANSENAEGDLTVPPPTTPPSNPPGGGGSGGGNQGWSGGGGSGSSFSPQPTQTVTVVDEPIKPAPELSNICFTVDGYARLGDNNNPLQVAKIQSFLLAYEGVNIPVTGIFDAATDREVRNFQRKYATDILLPWGVEIPTGQAYITTVKKMNEISCRIFRALTPEEQKIVDDYRNRVLTTRQGNGNTTLRETPGLPILQSGVEGSLAPVGEASSQEQVGAGQAARTAATGNIFNTVFSSIRGLFDRLFGR